MYLSVTAINEGRAAGEITGWGFDLGGDWNAFDLRPVPWQTSLPATLQAGHRLTFYKDVDWIKSEARTAGRDGEVRGFVDLATGRVKSRPRQLDL